MIYTLQVTTTGSAGNATGSAESQDPVRAEVECIQVKYNAMPVTTNVKVREVGGLGRVLLDVTGATDGVFYVRAPAVTSTNVSIANSYVSYVVENALLKVEVANANAATNAVTVSVQMTR